MNKTVFTGCSFTAGDGFALTKNEPALWVNLLHSSHLKLNQTQLINAGVGGRSNANIFKDTVFNLLTQSDVKYMFVEWTNGPRYALSLGLETYNTHQLFMPNTPMTTHNLHSITYSKQYLKKINDRFTALAHDHYEIVCLLEYIRLINLLCELKECQVFYINGLCPWDNNYFEKLENTLPSEYTNYTKKQLQTSTRDDNEVFELYDKIHHEYQTAGGIHQDLWLNLYSSMRDQRIDFNDDGVHPGIKSNQLYYQQFIQALDSKIL
jgi:hypothetical protein